jgi:hypothetical protein
MQRLTLELSNVLECLLFDSRTKYCVKLNGSINTLDAEDERLIPAMQPRVKVEVYSGTDRATYCGQVSH